MKFRIRVLEHEILKTIYEKSYFYTNAHGNLTDGHLAIYKREVPMSFLNFGTLADMINNPSKYKNVIQNPLQPIIKTVENVEDSGMKMYSWNDISNAIDVLAANEHVKDEIDGIFPSPKKRTIRLTLKGAIAFRDHYYIKDALKKKSEIRSYWLIRFWYIAEIIKFVTGGIIGALITLAVTQKGKSAPPTTKAEKDVTTSITSIQATTGNKKSFSILKKDSLAIKPHTK